ncbi:hypothetical protein C2845_PM01G09800 [Panicum miliaceum]|uniref:Uncharacterized protein n=1 Tax=Panicum miliaceum TaxID=4540 RepID=A0A3L6TIJ6_PANMI|nr:hypothetical protein C2845_PM01G09800 [Panicum miliaceum]
MMDGDGFDVWGSQPSANGPPTLLLPTPVPTSTRKRRRRRGSRGLGCMEPSSRATTTSSSLGASGAPGSLPIAYRVPEPETEGRLWHNPTLGN